MCNINVSILAAIVQRVLKQVRAMSDSFVSRSLLEQIKFGLRGPSQAHIYIYIPHMKIINSTVDRYTPVFINASSHWVDVKWGMLSDPISSQPSFPNPSPWKHRAGAKWWGLSKPIWKREVKSHEDVLASFPRLPCGTQGRALQVRDRPGRVRIFLYYRIFKTKKTLFWVLQKKSCQPKKNPSNGFCLVNCCMVPP